MSSGFVTVVGVLLAAGAMAGTVAPARLTGLGRQLDPLTVVRAGGAFRVIVGAGLVLAAPATRAPVPVVTLGLIACGAGCVLLALPRARAERVVGWVRAMTPFAVRGWCAFAALLGALLVYAARG